MNLENTLYTVRSTCVAPDENYSRSECAYLMIAPFYPSTILP